LQNQPSSRVPRLQVSRLGFVLLAATFLSIINAGSVLQRTSSFSRASPGIFALQTVIEVALLWCTMAALVLPAAFNNRILKIWTLLLVGLGFIASYYVFRLNVGIDISVIRSILSTDQQEVVEFIDPLSLLLLVAVVGATTALLAIISIVPRHQATGKIVLAPRPIGVLSLTSALLLGVFSSHHAFGQIDATQFFKTGLARYSPLNLLVYGVKYGRHAWRTRRVIVHDISPQFSLDDTARGGEVVVIVLGESARSANFQLAGYNRPTNPRLSRETDLIFFKDVTACRTHTAEAIPCLLTRFGSANLSFPIPEVSLISIFKRLGFQTKWYSMQATFEGTVQDICQEAGICWVADRTSRKQESNGRFSEKWDEKLLPFLKRSLVERKQDRLLVVLHLLGSHAVYSERYPRAWAYYQPECNGAAYTCPSLNVVNSYDNSIRYTDHVVGEAIEMLRAENAILFFTSDHGESLGELGVYGHGWPTSLAPEEQMKVPLAIWASPTFIANRKNEWASLRAAASKAAASKSVTHDYFFHTVLGCSGVRSTLLRSDLNLCADDTPKSVAAAPLPIRRN
jgi:glucan phosphoethanolaminetransferase (alkaline phosphatase superfamily)